jgi:hypothetical protein
VVAETLLGLSAGIATLWPFHMVTQIVLVWTSQHGNWVSREKDRSAWDFYELVLEVT